MFPIYGQFGATWKPDSGRLISVKLIFSLIVTFYLTKTANETKKAPTKLSHYYFE